MSYKLLKNKNWKEVEFNREMRNIPSHWNVQKTRDTIQLNMGNTPKKEGDNYSGDLPWITISNLNDKYISAYTAKIKKTNNIKVFPEGTLLVSFKMSVGKVGFTTEESAINEAIMGIQQSGTSNDLEYLYYSLPEIFINNADKNGQGLLLLNQEKIKDLDYFCPPLAEQKLISSILSKQDNIISNIKKVITKNEIIFKELSEKLLSGKNFIKSNLDKLIIAKNKNWKEVEFNREMRNIPSHWNVQKIRDTIQLNMGSTPRKEGDNYLGDLPWITISNLDNKYISAYTAKIKKTNNIRVFPQGTLLVSFKMSVGKAGFTTEDSAINEAIMGIQQSGTNNDLSYLYYCLQEVFFNNADKNGQGLLLLNQEKIKDLDYLVPPIDEQKLISQFLETREVSIIKLKQLLLKEKQKFEWLLDNLLSGNYLVEKIQ